MNKHNFLETLGEWLLPLLMFAVFYVLMYGVGLVEGPPVAAPETWNLSQ